MIPRYFGIDLHKNYVMVAAVDGDQQVVLHPTRVEMAHLADWAVDYLTKQDQVILEATSNAWPVVDLLRRYADEVVVANPYKTKLIAEARIKNDKVDAMVLAQLLAANFVCDVWVPDEQVREQRTLAAHRATLQRQCTCIKNRVHAVLRRHNRRCPEKSLFSTAGLEWLRALTLPLADELQVRHLLDQLSNLEAQLDETDRLIARQAASDPRVPMLMQMTGIGYYSAFTILSVIGNVQRFPSSRKLSAYAGLVPSQHQSGQRTFNGHITKQGHPMLRWLLVEAARSAVRWDPHWRQVHRRIALRRGTNIATVAVAWRLLVTIWHLLSDKTPYLLSLQTC
jgi:transposase